jgi:hypothetical protein
VVVGEPEPGHYRWPPKIQVTGSLFEASMAEQEDFDQDGKRACWHIRQDSKIWRTALSGNSRRGA